MSDPYTQNAPQGQEAYAQSAPRPGDEPREDEHVQDQGEPSRQEEAGQQPPALDPDAPGEDEDLVVKLAEAERERDEYLDHLRRERAEFENFRRRTTKERMDALDRGAAQLLTGLLPVLDNFGFALDAARTSVDEQLAKGVQMVHSQLIEVLGQAGLEEVPAVGETFDPTYHEAVMSEDAEEPLEEPIVVEVLRTGYRFKGRVLRPASVKVAR